MNIAEQRYRDLQSLARASERSMQELLTLYALECFLSRVAQSSMREKLVLKGGVLLAAFDARRPTRDIDFSAASAETIRDDDEYSGVRV